MGQRLLQFKKKKKPSLCDLEAWLQERILPAKEAFIPTRERLKRKQGQDSENTGWGKHSPRN